MRICVILEGCYPYVTGGVSSWMHQYIQAMPQHEFVVWAINSDPSQNGQFRYTLPDNVVEIREISLTGTEGPRAPRPARGLRFDETELRAMHDL
ncbi:MAG: DUF3492 domain-containing protein, partial [Lachnospiraceae bacterium]|nr:DUF3492 domain-containing protein [Lachnospiraceae bacterium]